MASNETFDNTSVYIASFSTENATILDYSEYTCKTINLISKKKSSRYLKLDSGLWITLIFSKKSLLFVIIVYGIVLANIKWYQNVPMTLFYRDER